MLKLISQLNRDIIMQKSINFLEEIEIYVYTNMNSTSKEEMFTQLFNESKYPVMILTKGEIFESFKQNIRSSDKLFYIVFTQKL